jgi:hypothetical protein
MFLHYEGEIISTFPGQGVRHHTVFLVTLGGDTLDASKKGVTFMTSTGSPSRLSSWPLLKPPLWGGSLTTTVPTLQLPCWAPVRKALPWALSWGECKGLAMGPILGRVWRSCQWHPAMRQATSVPCARLQAWTLLASTASEEHLSLVTPLIPGGRTQSMTTGCWNMPKHANKRQTRRIY